MINLLAFSAFISVVSLTFLVSIAISLGKISNTVERMSKGFYLVSGRDKSGVKHD